MTPKNDMEFYIETKEKQTKRRTLIENVLSTLFSGLTFFLFCKLHF